jgi:hypothetical protein
MKRIGQILLVASYGSWGFCHFIVVSMITVRFLFIDPTSCDRPGTLGQTGQLAAQQLTPPRPDRTQDSPLH